MVQSTARTFDSLRRTTVSFADLRNGDDAQLVRAHLEGDERAFTVLVERYQTRLQNFVYRIVGDRERSEDLVQEAFIRVHRHLGRFDRTKKFSTWVYTIASNLAKNELRNRARNPLVLFTTLAPVEDDERPLEFEDPDNRPDEVFRRQHIHDAVHDSVRQLPAHHRHVFVLREIEGRSYDEIATMTNCNLGTVKSRLNRARNAFAEIVEPALR